jgi:hypothetical protein
MDDRIYPLTWVTVQEGVVTQHERPPSVSSNWEEAFGEGYVPAAQIAELEKERDEALATTVAAEFHAEDRDRLSAMLKEAEEALKTSLEEMRDYSDSHPSFVEVYNAWENIRSARLEPCGDPPSDDTALINEVQEAVSGVIEIVEGVRGAMEHGTWRAERSNLRMKDTDEWVRLYNLRRALLARLEGREVEG